MSNPFSVLSRSCLLVFALSLAFPSPAVEFAQSAVSAQKHPVASPPVTRANSAAPPAKSKSSASPLTHAQLASLLRRKIKYLFVIYQENRSFDSYFGTFPGADGLFSRPLAQTPGFAQPLLDTNGSTITIEPFRI